MATMPEHKGPDLQEDRDIPKFDYITYMQRYLGGGTGSASGTASGHHSDDEDAKVNGSGD